MSSAENRATDEQRVTAAPAIAGVVAGWTGLNRCRLGTFARRPEGGESAAPYTPEPRRGADTP